MNRTQALMVVTAVLVSSACLNPFQRTLAGEKPASGATGSATLPVADVQVDFAAATEAVVGNNRVALLSVTRFTEFVAGEDGRPRSVTSLRIMYLREWLGEPVPVLTASEVEVFAASTTDSPVRFASSSHSTLQSSKNYGGYADWLRRQADEWSAVKLPKVKDANLATVYGVTFQDVQVKAQKADVRIKTGDGVVMFQNVPFE